jgi:hypothetical protein
MSPKYQAGRDLRKLKPSLRKATHAFAAYDEAIPQEYTERMVAQGINRSGRKALEWNICLITNVPAPGAYSFPTFIGDFP